MFTNRCLQIIMQKDWFKFYTLMLPNSYAFVMRRTFQLGFLGRLGKLEQDIGIYIYSTGFGINSPSISSSDATDSGQFQFISNEKES